MSDAERRIPEWQFKRPFRIFDFISGNWDMHKLIILRGNSGSGKTAVAKALQERFGPNTMLISQDMVRMQMLNVRGREGAEKSQQLMIELLKYGRRNSNITILEGILDSEVHTALFAAAVKEYGNNIHAYYWDIPFKETVRRHKTKPNCNDFGENDMRRWWKEKDLLTVIPEKIIGMNITLDDTVDMIYRSVVE